MNKIKCRIPKLTRVDADVCNGYSEDEIPRSPKMKTKKDLLVEKAVYALKNPNPLKDIQSPLMNPIVDTYLLEAPEENIVAGKYDLFTRKKVLQFLGFVRNGMTIQDSTMLMGWKIDTVNYWIKNNRGNFATCIDIAKAEFKLYHVASVNNKDYQYQASAWMLERKHKEEFGKELKVTPGTNDADKQILRFGDREISF